MATLMEKDALLNGASQCIAFLSNIIDNCSVSSHQDSGDALKRLVSYRDYLYSTPAELVDFTQGKGNDSNLLIVFYVQIMPDDLVMQLHRF